MSEKCAFVELLEGLDKYLSKCLNRDCKKQARGRIPGNGDGVPLNKGHQQYWAKIVSRQTRICRACYLECYED